VGCLAPEKDNETGYEELGLASRWAIEALLPDDWGWKGKSVLDFGCGASKTLRHFLDEAGEAEFWGADIDRPSIDWNVKHLSPPLHFVQNDEAPPLPIPDGKFDLVYAISVFTHLTDLWAQWLLDLHRVLAPDGLLVATFMGEGMSEPISGEPWDEHRVGMNVFEAGQSWNQGGPMVLMSPWWIREHWGRLLKIETVIPERFGGAHDFGVHNHGAIVARKDGRPLCSEAELKRIDFSDARECEALEYNVGTLIAESARNRACLYDLLEASATVHHQELDSPNPGIRASCRLLVGAVASRLRLTLGEGSERPEPCKRG
jgi:SAM-dependent methyltransferase